MALPKADALKQWRAEMGWTQREAAAYMGFTLRGYQNLEEGKTRLSFSFWQACRARWLASEKGQLALRQQNLTIEQRQWLKKFVEHVP